MQKKWIRIADKSYVLALLLWNGCIAELGVLSSVESEQPQIDS